MVSRFNTPCGRSMKANLTKQKYYYMNLKWLIVK